ncbi:MAG TPA: tRNA (adenosine(37)-N6)-threonylcarbamoyltransferase complex dimerization subunit type 1 TsaB [Pseudonocardiaceae bacterium]|nr:tRNA (adenosine(37)-N6)-threonylcarbamoyltransferase complex dimerization subunit type 1 TsaB [Pseudonocardiaceae bacterium]
MIVLAIDTATPAITAGLVALGDGWPETLAQRVTVNARAHGELLTPQIQQVLAEAGVALGGLDAIVCGAGPGPFTGLRVGMVTAAAFGDALDVPVHPVCSLDAIAADVTSTEPFAVVTDARRREVYWAAYEPAGERLDGPTVQQPAEITEALVELGVRSIAGEGAIKYADVLGLPVVDPAYPSPRGLVVAAATALRTGAAPAPLTTLYLRRPDAMESVPRKQVSRL